MAAGFIGCFRALRLVAGAVGAARSTGLQPAVRVRRLALDDLEEPLLDRLGDRARGGPRPILTRSTDRIGVTSTAVPTKNTSSAMYSISRGSVCSRTSKPRSRAMRDHRVARDARQHRVADRRRVDDAVADDEHVLAAAFAEVAAGVERDALGIAVGHRLHLDQLRVGVVGDALGHRRRRVRRVARPGRDLDVDALPRSLPW